MDGVSFSISWPDNTFLAEFAGQITAEEIEVVNHAFSGDERLDTVRYSIWDFSGASSLEMPPYEIEYAAAFDKGVSVGRKNLRGALIASNDEVKDCIEKYLAIADALDVNWDTRHFDNIQAAKDWLEGHP